jgi:hypothetical protein
VFANKVKRVQTCIDARGHHFQHLLYVHSDFPNALYKRLASGHGNDSDAFHVTSDRLWCRWISPDLLKGTSAVRYMMQVTRLGTKPDKDLRNFYVFTWFTELPILCTQFSLLNVICKLTVPLWRTINTRKLTYLPGRYRRYTQDKQLRQPKGHIVIVHFTERLRAERTVRNGIKSGNFNSAWNYDRDVLITVSNTVKENKILKWKKTKTTRSEN